MEPNPIRVIALCSCILGAFFLAKSISIKTPKYVLHELLAFKVNKSRFFRKYINQKLDAIIGLLFLVAGFGLQVYLEVDALGRGEAGSAFANWWGVVGVTLIVMAAIAILLYRITRYLSGKVFVEHVRFMVVAHGYPLEGDSGLVRELGRILRVPRDDEDTVESYVLKVLKKMKIEHKGAGRRPY